MLAALLFAALSVTTSGGAAPRPDQVVQSPSMPAYRSACIRSLRDFAYALSSAVESGDVNRLAELYRWQGLSTRAGYDAMARLQEIVARPLLEVAPVYPQQREPEFALSGPAAAQSALPAQDSGMYPPLTGPPMFEVPVPGDGSATHADPVATGAAGPTDVPAPRPPPVALRIDQTLANGVTPATTTLRLQRELGCWWVSL